VRIVDIEIRACRVDRSSVSERSALDGTKVPDVVVITLTTDSGVRGTSFGFGGLDSRNTARAFAQVAPFFLDRDPLAHERNLREFRHFDRRWNLSPIYAYGPFDVACWDIAGQVAGMPVHHILGAAHDRLPVYASSLFFATVDDYVTEARSVRADGFAAYKIHPPGLAALDLEVYRAVRDEVGPDFTLMADPVATHTLDEAVMVGRELEKLGYLWFEEPLDDYDIESLIQLSRELEIPIAGAESIAGGALLTAQYISSGALDIVRADVSWRGGITAALDVARLADDHGIACELHTTIYHPLELANLQCALAIPNTTYFEVLYPLDTYAFGLAEPLDIREGFIYPPSAPGIGAVYDWNAIDAATVEVLSISAESSPKGSP
jgi:L-alanine-DL-glutamate epimerase-like enolase superfamily enzyme